MPKKYSRVKQHLRHINNLVIIVRAHIRKNPRFKEIKMSNELTSSPGEETEGQVGVLKDGEKPFKLRQVSVVIFYADNHYLASFNHNPRRVFHNMPELLTAIEVECKKRVGALVMTSFSKRIKALATKTNPNPLNISFSPYGRS